MNYARNLVIFVIFLSLVFTSFPLIPYARAATPTISNACGNPASTSLTVACTATTTKGNIEIITVIFTQRSASCPPVVNSVTDNDGNTWSRLYADDCEIMTGSTWNYGGEAWTATALSSDSDAITVHFSSSMSRAFISILDTTGLVSPSLANSAWATGACAASCTSATGSIASLDYGNNDILVGMLGCDSSNCLTAAGSGYSLYTHPTSNNVLTQYGTSVAITAPSTFPFTIGVVGDWIEFGIAIGLTAPTVTTVVACTFFQLQCWWYPMLFFSCYAGGFLLVGSVGKASAKGMTYLLLSGLTFGGLIQVQMGMLNIMFPLIFTFLTVLYMVRYK